MCYAAWLGLVSIAAVLITGRYEVALALEHDGEPRRVGVFAAAACIGAGGVVLLLVIVVLVAAEAPCSVTVVRNRQLTEE